MHGFPAIHARTLGEAKVLAESPAAKGQDLATYLYTRWYAATGTETGLDPAWPPLEGMLRVAQSEVLGWQPALVLRQGASGIVLARGADGRARALLRGGYTHQDASEHMGLPPQRGDSIVAVPRSGAVVSEGWWRTWGCGWDPRSAPEGVTRVYIGPKLVELPVLMAALTVTLQTHAVPWMIKVATQAGSLARPDAVVLYLRSTAAFEDIVAAARDRVRKEPGPALTETLAPGVSWAQDPGDGRSFGESRCSLVATALLRASNGGTEAFLGILRQEFVAAGLDPAAPHLCGRANG
ncbi:T3SS effector HopA1 family protein [Arthrobacter sp. LAPM80]|uniref:T3SS effector HopA1 family protein n=1 Tax=Arthrobacter sp. LAPM80 TaxID=3141788 RepID=UPI00398A799C